MLGQFFYGNFPPTVVIAKTYLHLLQSVVFYSRCRNFSFFFFNDMCSFTPGWQTDLVTRAPDRNTKTIKSVCGRPVWLNGVRFKWWSDIYDVGANTEQRGRCWLNAESCPDLRWPPWLTWAVLIYPLQQRASFTPALKTRRPRGEIAFKQEQLNLLEPLRRDASENRGVTWKRRNGPKWSSFKPNRLWRLNRRIIFITWRHSNFPCTKGRQKKDTSFAQIKKSRPPQITFPRCLKASVWCGGNRFDKQAQ